MKRTLCALLLGACLCGGCGLHIPESPGAPPTSPAESTEFDKMDLAECRAQKAKEDRAAAEHQVRSKVLANRICKLAIARVQAWLDYSALALALLGVGFLVAAIWVAPIRGIVLYVSGGCFTLALALKLLSVVWPWITAIAIVAGILGAVVLAWYVARLRAGKADLSEAFAIASKVADKLGDTGALAQDRVQAFIEELANAKRLNRETLKALRDKLAGG